MTVEGTPGAVLTPGRDAPDWDEPGVLSIVVQGGLLSGNVADTASHCRHWRELFPAAQIILSISSTDLLADVRPGVTTTLDLARSFRDNLQLRSALQVIAETCERVVIAESALPLPPLKSDLDRPNNINFQIAAAKAGLRHASGRYTLRVRSDLVFADRDFVEQYREGSLCPRGEGAAFAQRVLVSSLYTLNPFTFERMPLHISDWFHFGLTEDIRGIWAVAPMTYADATYYQTHPHHPGSSVDERLLLCRVADEQHVLYHRFKQAHPNLTLDYHNDRSSIDLCVDILADDFMICDLVRARCMFPKYRMDFHNPAKRLHCVSREDWLALTQSSGAGRRRVLEGKRALAARPETQPFPRSYAAEALRTKIGHRGPGTIFASRATGVILHGPYDTLPRGRYVATLHVPMVEAPGMLDLCVSIGEGVEAIARRHVTIGAGVPVAIDIPFDVRAATIDDFELIVTADKVGTIVIAGLTVWQRPADYRERHEFAFAAGSPPMQTDVGARTHAGVTTTGKAGHLLYGPYIALPAGAYCVTLTIPSGVAARRSYIEIAAGERHKILSRRRIFDTHLGAGRLRHDFKLDRMYRDVEFRVRVDSRAQFVIDSIRIESA